MSFGAPSSKETLTLKCGGCGVVETATMPEALEVFRNWKEWGGTNKKTEHRCGDCVAKKNMPHPFPGELA